MEPERCEECGGEMTPHQSGDYVTWTCEACSVDDDDESDDCDGYGDYGDEWGEDDDEEQFCHDCGGPLAEDEEYTCDECDEEMPS